MWCNDRKAFEKDFQERKKELKMGLKRMKATLKEKKHEGITEDEKKQLKELKALMKREIRMAKADFAHCRSSDKDAWKAWKESMKDKKDKMEKKDKKEKREKKDKEERREKKARFVARHVADLTIPDGAELPPDTPFLKTWRIRNEGVAWPAGCQLLFVSHKGDNLNGPERVDIKGDVQPGQEIDVSVPIITPTEPGRYVGYYRMVTPDGVKFGQRVWVSFVVKADANAANATAAQATAPVDAMMA